MFTRSNYLRPRGIPMSIRATRLLPCLFIVAFMTVVPLHAQMIATPDQIALGGGVAYSTGLSAHFNNPANLMVRKGHRRHEITLGLGGVHRSTGVSVRNAMNLPDEVLPYFIPEYPEPSPMVTPADLERYFHASDRFHQTHSYEVIPVGYTWTGKNRAYSIAMRSRGISSFEFNSNWFESADESSEAEAVFVRFLNDNYQVHHEISFAMAREVTMINQWQAGLNTLYIGLAPKVLFGGMHSRTRYRSEYHAVDEGWQNSVFMEVQTSGDMTRYLEDLLATGNAAMAYNNRISPSSSLNTSGIGIGLDAGLTYIIPLGDDISLSPHSEEPLRKSLRLSVALTDLGAIHYSGNPGDWASRTVIRTYPDIQGNQMRYHGKPGELLRYIQDDSVEESVMDNLNRTDDTAFSIQLPTEVHLGAALQYRFFASVIDLNYRFNSPDFRTDGWRVSTGAEIRPLRFLPLMGSFQLNPGGETAIGAGMGLDVGYIRASGAVRFFRTDEEDASWYVNSISALSLQVRF
jgi:hypothetical protein